MYLPTKQINTTNRARHFSGLGEFAINFFGRDFIEPLGNVFNAICDIDALCYVLATQIKNSFEPVDNWLNMIWKSKDEARPYLGDTPDWFIAELMDRRFNSDGSIKARGDIDFYYKYHDNYPDSGSTWLEVFSPLEKSVSEFKRRFTHLAFEMREAIYDAGFNVELARWGFTGKERMDKEVQKFGSVPEMMRHFLPSELGAPPSGFQYSINIVNPQNSSLSGPWVLPAAAVLVVAGTAVYAHYQLKYGEKIDGWTEAAEKLHTQVAEFNNTIDTIRAYDYWPGDLRHADAYIQAAGEILKYRRKINGLPRDHQEEKKYEIPKSPEKMDRLTSRQKTVNTSWLIGGSIFVLASFGLYMKYR